MWHAALRHNSNLHASSVKCAELAPRCIARTVVSRFHRAAEKQKATSGAYPTRESAGVIAPDRILRSALGTLSDGKVSEVVQQFDDLFTFNDYALAVRRRRPVVLAIVALRRCSSCASRRCRVPNPPFETWDTRSPKHQANVLPATSKACGADSDMEFLWSRSHHRRRNFQMN
jgi:hypothetical protein